LRQQHKDAQDILRISESPFFAAVLFVTEKIQLNMMCYSASVFEQKTKKTGDAETKN